MPYSEALKNSHQTFKEYYDQPRPWAVNKM